MRARIEAVAAPDYAQTMLAANSPGAERLARGPIGVGVSKGVQTLYEAVPIGYRVESFDAERARVLTWGFTLLGNAASVGTGRLLRPHPHRARLDRRALADRRDQGGLRPDAEAGDEAGTARRLRRDRPRTRA